MTTSTRVLSAYYRAPIRAERADHDDQYTDFPTFAPVLAGEVLGRRDNAESVFSDNRAVGIQFAAVADLAYERPVDRGLGTAVPSSDSSRTSATEPNQVVGPESGSADRRVVPVSRPLRFPVRRPGLQEKQD